VTDQEIANGGAIDTGITLATGKSLVIHDAVAEGLEGPFYLALLTGIFSFIYCSARYYGLRNHINATEAAAKADRAKKEAAKKKEAAAKTKGQDESNAVRNVDSESVAESVVKESATTAAGEASRGAEKVKLIAEV
jgi:hypothetical protein